LGQNLELSKVAHQYCRVFLWAIPFDLAFYVLAKWLQGQKIVRVTTVAVILANLVNIIGNYLFIHFFEYGVIGSAISTVLCTMFQFVILAYLSQGMWMPVWRKSFVFDPEHLKKQLRIGIPASLQISFECWGFTATTILVGWMGEVYMAAHAISLNVATVLFMIPLGLSASSSTNVGNYIGRGKDWRVIAKLSSLFVGITQIILGALLYTLAPTIAGFYTTNPQTISLSVEICSIVALFQVFDGGQVVGFGVLRGMSDVFIPAIIIIVCHWLVGLPLGYLLAFTFGMTLHGIWIGLSIALGLAALMAWARIIWFGRRK
jgi:multidrug resistance protein, MATE family